MVGYKIVNGISVKMTDAEVLELKNRPAPNDATPTPEERLAAAEAQIAAATAELERAKAELLGIIDTMEGSV